MAGSNPTIVVGQLDSSRLEKSIDDLISLVETKIGGLATSFNNKFGQMQASLQGFANTMSAVRGDAREMAASLDSITRATRMGSGGTRGASARFAPNTGSDALLGELEQAKRELEQLRRGFQANSIEVQQLTNRIGVLKSRIREAKTESPKSLNEVLGMNESSIDAISKKMSALRMVQINPNNTLEVKRLGQAYQELSMKQKEMMGKNAQFIDSNNALARSFGYIRNRIVYMLTLGAMTSFVRQIYEIRGQYELLERSLGVLTNNMRKGTEIFNELNEMAIKSPFTLIELGTAAKQLTAYNFAADEVVDTTRRLADISAALGVPMERLTYNLGQIKAQGVLNARDARDFANAGLAIVPMLAEMYTKQKKFGDELVTTSKVYSMMSKKLVTYKDVMTVLTQITDEGGKFFNFQAKQADTLRVKMANLSLAFNNMLNDIGTDYQEGLEMPLKLLKSLFENWRNISSIITKVIATYGLYRAAALTVYAINNHLIMQGITKMFFSLGQAIAFAKNALIAFRTVAITNPIGLLATALASAVTYFAVFNDSVDEAAAYTERFGKDGGKTIRDVESLYKALESLDKGTSTYKKVLGELNQILGDFNLKTIDENDGIREIISSRERNLQLIKEEIIERKKLNDLEQGKTEYDNSVENMKKQLYKSLSNAITENIFSFGTINEEVKKNAPALTTIISSIIEENIDLVANKTGKEYEKGVDRIFEKIQERLRNNKGLNLSEETLNRPWLENDFLRFYDSNIIRHAIEELKEAKEANNAYNESIEANYKAEKQATEQGASFNDRVEQTSQALLKSAHDSDKLHGAIEQIIKDYSGQNIIDFLVRVNAKVPKWMMDKSIGELSRLAAKFGALAKNATGDVSVNGKRFTKEELATRAALYAEAVTQKQANEESEKSETITRKASEALKDYKSALDAVKVAQNLVKQGEKDSAFVKNKEKEAQEAYNKALKAGVSEKDLYDAKFGKKGGGAKKDPLGDALSKEVQLIGEVQKRFKEYKKMGVDTNEALTLASKEYNKSLVQQNSILSRYGLNTLSTEQLATMPLQRIRDFYKEQLTGASASTKGVEALEKAIANLNVEITKIDYEKITKGLNSELSKLKDEYELAIELDANPEVGNAFLDMMGIDPSTLPQSVEAYAKEYTNLLNKYLKESGSSIELPHLYLTDDDIRMFEEMSGDDKLNEVWVENIKKGVDEIRKVRKKDIEDTMKDWEKLLEKYAEYEVRRKKIQDEAEHERQVARKKGASQEIIDAINNRENQELAQLDFEQFKRAPEWISATGDIANMTRSALGMLIDELENYKKTAKNLTPKQIKEINKALRTLYKEQRKHNPFHAIGDAISEAKARMEDYDEEIKDLEKTKKKWDKQTEDGIVLTAEEAEKYGKLIKRLKELKEHREQVGKIDASSIVQGINDAIQVASQATQQFTAMADALGGKGMTRASKVVSGVMQNLQAAGAGAAIGAQVGGGWGAAIGAIAGGLMDAFTQLADIISGNAKINNYIKLSELEVKRLDLAYKNLEYSVNQAYGTAVVGAQQAVIANKKLQLAELERQLSLEMSRKQKNKDDERILELKGEIVDLKNEINDAINEVTNNLLGISSVGDAVENMVGVVIDALRSGENAIDAWNDSIDDMIVNMIKKFVATKMVAPLFEKAWDEINDDIQKRSQEPSDIVQRLKAERQRYYDTPELLGNLGVSAGDKTLFGIDAINYLDRMIAEAEEKVAEASSITRDDLEKYIQILNNLKAEGQGVIDYTDDLLEQYGLKDDGNANLSALQQGIKGITEDQAGALEAYWNANTQQQYVQSDLLTQIRNAVIGFDIDMQTATQAQMLLQLQQSYQVQMSIQSILEGWSSANGLAVKVEMI